MTCIDNLLGIKGGCNPKSASNYIDSVGISLNELNQYVTKNYATGEQLFEEKREFAFKSMSELITSKLSNALTGTTIAEAGSIGYVTKTNALINSLSGQWVGFEVEQCGKDAPLSFYLNTLKLYADYTGTVEVRVYDVKRKAIIDTIEIDAVQGEIAEVEVNRSYSSTNRGIHLAFLYESNFKAYNTWTHKNSCFDCGVTMGWCNCSRSMQVRGMSATDMLASKRSIAYTYGLFADYSLQCDYSIWLCTFANRLVIPLSYLIGAELMDFSIGVGSKVRHNNSVIDIETNTLRRDGMMAKYHESIDNLIKNISIPSDSICFNCRKRVIYT